MTSMLLLFFRFLLLELISGFLCTFFFLPFIDFLGQYFDHGEFLLLVEILQLLQVGTIHSTQVFFFGHVGSRLTRDVKPLIKADSCHLVRDK